MTTTKIRDFDRVENKRNIQFLRNIFKHFQKKKKYLLVENAKI